MIVTRRPCRLQPNRAIFDPRPPRGSNMRIPPLVLFGLLTLAGCASNPGIVQTAPGVYFISREDKAGVFGNASAMKADVIAEANAFAAKQGKVAIALSTHETPMYPMHFATFDYQFRLVDPDSPE